MEGKVIIFSAPSGSGKSTIINHLMGHPELNLEFSVSCTSRPPRGRERDGVEYHFVTPVEFRRMVDRGEFLEYEEVYRDRYYGTLRGHVEGRLAAGRNVVADVDVKGGCAIKAHFGDRALALFIEPPSLGALRERLEKRGTDSPEVIADRLERASFEMSFAPRFDAVIVNDSLEMAQREALRLVGAFLGVGG